MVSVAGLRQRMRWPVRLADGLLASESPGDAMADAAGWQRDADEAYCHRCGRSVGPGEATETGCGGCRGEKLAWDRVLRLGEYKTLGRWIVDMKFHGAWSWGPWLGEKLADAARGAVDGQTVVTHVPLHWRRRWGRGYDPSHLMATAMAAGMGCPWVRLLRRIRATPQQSLAQNKAQRRANVRGAFAMRRPIDLSGWTVWLVDDVTTTGATATQCARLLRKAGADRVNLAVAAVAR